MAGAVLVTLAAAVSLILVNFAYAETITNEQVTLSGDLQNNPVAQDILKKIEKSKRWIEQIQQRNFEESERQKELEEKRTEVLEHLQEDLEKWEELWGYYTFDSMLERALKNNPANSTDTIYDHPLKFTASKINAGREAMEQVVKAGGGPEEARDAFVEAAKITRAEMLSANILFNVLNNNAYYNQQILFESDGNFNLDISGEQLRKYYQDYRTNPGYLKANPFDKISWEDLGKNSPATECRPGYTLVYRTHAEDYVCTTEYTAEMWIRHKMGTIVDEKFSEAKAVDVKKLEQDRINEKVNSLNSRIQTMQEHYEKKMSETKQKYEALYAETAEEKNNEEKNAIAKFGNAESKRKILSKEVTDIREKYSQLEQSITDDKLRILNIFEEQHITDLEDFAKSYEHDDEMKLVWQYGIPVFETNYNKSDIS